MFNRPPRIRKSKQEYVVKIPAQVQLPAKPKINWLTIGLPLVGVGLAIGLMALISNGSVLSYLMFLPLMVASVLAGVINHFVQQKEYNKSVIEEIKNYSLILDEKEAELKRNFSEQKAAFFETDPDLSECYRRAKEKDECLGERRPGDDDFLSFRVGVGNQDSGIEIDVPPDDKRETLFTDLYNRADKFKQTFTSIPNSPITTNLRIMGGVGASGSRDDTAFFARASMMHLTTHHWPAEVEIAIFCDPSRLSEWKWVDHLPHKSKLFITPSVVEVSASAVNDPSILALERELRRRQEYRIGVQSISNNNQYSGPLPALVIIFDHVPNIYNHAAFSLILKKGGELGMYGIYLTDRFEEIPGECGAAVEITNGEIVYKETGPHKNPIPDIHPDKPLLAEAEKFAQSLEIIQWLIPAQVTEPPERLSLLELFGISNLEGIPIEKWWDGDWSDDDRLGYLRAPLGKFSPSADLIFDLNDRDDAHGPHGIIGGTTGSGKSEVLKTLILSLALTHSPYDINFALIDYKGGAAFNELENLPHVVGIITDIENHADYATRVIQALTGEINNRKQILEDARIRSGLKRPHINDYHQLLVKRPLPRLIIIFDEYAEFKDRHPDESQKLISIARVGRSLGVHLILCTQNPAAAVDQQVRQNTKFRICMRVSSPEDSKGLIGIPDAWQLPTGLAFMQVKQPQKFRVAYTGGSYPREQNSQLSDDAIYRLQPDDNRHRLYPIVKHQIVSESLTEARAIVNKVVELSNSLGLNSPPKVWPDPLPERLYLPELLAKACFPTSWNGDDWDIIPPTGLGEVVGLYDDPIHQKQPLYCFKTGKGSGHLLVFGASGSGKSTFLKTIAISLALVNSPKQVNIYCMDFGGQNSLKELKDLPHIPSEGGVINADEKERISRLFGMLRAKIAERNELFHAQKKSDILSYNNSLPVEEHLPNIYLLIDGLNKQFLASTSGFAEQLDEIVRSGRSVGIHVIITANLTQDIPSTVFADIDERLSFFQGNKSEMEGIVGHPSVAIAQKVEAGQLPAGRGLLKHVPVMEMQVALPVDGSDNSLQSSNLSQLIKSMNRSWKNNRPPNVEKLPLFISSNDPRLSGKIIYGDGQMPLLGLPLGVGQERLEPVGLSLDRDGPTFLLASSDARLGKSTIIQTWLLGLAEQYSPEEVQFIIVDFHCHDLRQFSKLPHTRKFVAVKGDLGEMLDDLEKQVRNRQEKLEKMYASNPDDYDESKYLQEQGYIVAVIDDFDTFRAHCPNENNRLGTCIQDGEEVGVRLIIAENTAMLSPASDNVLKRVEKHGCGILLGGSENLGIFNNAKPPYGQKTSNLPAGRGYLINRGQVQLFQAAAYWADVTISESDKVDYLKKRIQKITKQ